MSNWKITKHVSDTGYVYWRGENARESLTSHVSEEDLLEWIKEVDAEYQADITKIKEAS
jgi:hypothetical protein